MYIYIHVYTYFYYFYLCKIYIDIDFVFSFIIHSYTHVIFSLFSGHPSIHPVVLENSRKELLKWPWIEVVSLGSSVVVRFHRWGFDAGILGFPSKISRDENIGSKDLVKNLGGKTFASIFFCKNFEGKKKLHKKVNVFCAKKELYDLTFPILNHLPETNVA